MGQSWLNEGLARAAAKKGEPSRNPTGWNNPRLGKWRREFRAQLDIIGNEFCDLHDHSPPMRRAECMARVLWEAAQYGHRWAVHELLNRWQGRVPFQVDVKPQSDLSTLSDDELRARLETLREQMSESEQRRLPEPEVIDVVD